jgi:hypothetical protein
VILLISSMDLIEAKGCSFFGMSAELLLFCLAETVQWEVTGVT